MSDVYSLITDMIGTVPDGLEPVAWVVSAIVFLFVVSTTYRIVISIFSWFK